MTNQEISSTKILRGGNAHEKEYAVAVDHPVTEEFLKQMCEGVRIEDLDVTTKPCRAWKTGSHTFHIVLTQGIKPTDPPDVPCARLSCDESETRAYHEHPAGYIKAREYRGADGKELSDLMKLVEGSDESSGERSCEDRKTGGSGKSGRKNSPLRISGKEERQETVCKMVRESRSRKRAEPERSGEMSARTAKRSRKRSPASPESWKPGVRRSARSIKYGRQDQEDEGADPASL